MQKKTIIGIVIVLVLVVVVAILARPKSSSTTSGGSTQSNQTSDAGNETAVRSLVTTFGQQLQKVSLLAPTDNVKSAMDQYYAPYVSPQLLDAWETDPSIAPGRETSSPYPARIDITSVIKLTDTNYKVEGNVIELTSEEETQGGIAAQYGVTFTVDAIAGEWRITSYSHDAGL